MKKAIIQTILSFALLLSVSKAAAQPANCYVQLDEASGFDVSSYQSELNLVACDLAASFPDSIENQFKVFSFGFYLNLEFYDEYSYPQAFGDMSAGVAQQSPYYLLIGRQSDHSGVFTRFWLDLKLPDTGIFSCATAEQLEALKTRLLVAIEYDYFKNGKLAPEYAQAEMRGMEALKEHVLSLYECCDPQNRGVGTCDDCLSFESFKEVLLHYGYEQVSLNNISAVPKSLNDGIFNEEAEVYFAENDSMKSLNSRMKVYLDSLNEYVESVKGEILFSNSFNCSSILSDVGKPLGSEFAKISIIIKYDSFGIPHLFTKTKYSDMVTAKKKVIVLALKGHGLDLTTLKTKLVAFIKLGNCSPIVDVSRIDIKEKINANDKIKGNYLIILGNNQKKAIYNLFKKPNGELCDFVSLGFLGESFWPQNNVPNSDPGLTDNGQWQVAAVDRATINPSKLKLSGTGSQEKATAFVIYHELGHMTRHWGHSGLFSPNGLLAESNGIYYILGTKELTSGGDERFRNKYDNLNDLILDPKKIYLSENHRNHHLKICEALQQ